MEKPDLEGLLDTTFVTLRENLESRIEFDKIYCNSDRGGEYLIFSLKGEEVACIEWGDRFMEIMSGRR